MEIEIKKYIAASLAVLIALDAVIAITLARRPLLSEEHAALIVMCVLLLGGVLMIISCAIRRRATYGVNGCIYLACASVLLAFNPFAAPIAVLVWGNYEVRERMGVRLILRDALLGTTSVIQVYEPRIYGRFLAEGIGEGRIEDFRIERDAGHPMYKWADSVMYVSEYGQMHLEEIQNNELVND